MCGRVMGKKSRKQQQVESKVKLCHSLIDKRTCQLVDTLLERTSKFSLSAPINPTATVWDDYEAIVSLGHAIRQRQGPSPMPLPLREEAIPEFVAWLKANGTMFDKIEIAECPGMEYGLRVCESVKEEEKVIEVPKNLLFCAEYIMSDSLAGFVKSEPILAAMPNLVLALLLLNERYSPTSFWKPYINVLPNSVDLPLHFKREDLDELQGSHVLLECISQVRNISRLYTILHQQLRAHANLSLPLCTIGFNFSDFLWAVSCVMSRQNKIPSSRKPGDYVLALIPLWDMANHTAGRILTDFDPATQACISYSMSDLSPGDEFRIFYGPRGNGELLLNQGFTYEDNPYDIVKIWVGLSSGKDDQKLCKTIFERLRLPISGQFVLKQGSAPFGIDVVSFVRLFTATVEQLKSWEQDDIESVKEQLLLKKWVHGDEKVLEFLEKRCQLLLHPYKTTIVEDESLLTTVRPGRKRNTIILRLSEKRILNNAALFALKTRQQLEEGLEIEWKKKENTEEDKTQVKDIPEEVEENKTQVRDEPGEFDGNKMQVTDSLKVLEEQDDMKDREGDKIKVTDNVQVVENQVHRSDEHDTNGLLEIGNP